MRIDNFEQQQEGARLIVKKVYQLAKENGITLDKIKWDDNQLKPNRSQHLLTISTNGKTLKGKIAEESLEDYPERSGNEKIDKVLLYIIHQLR